MKYLLLFENFDQKRVDNILDKISANGYDALSKEDKDYLSKSFGDDPSRNKETDKQGVKPIKINNMKTGKLIDHFTDEEKNWLQSRIDNPDVYSLPTMDEVIEYLKSTSDSEPSEEVMDDLIIQYLEDEGLMFDFC
jgi:hypothetical protein